MGNRNIVNGLALIGAILVLVGVTIAANTALAEEAKGGRALTATSDSLLDAGRANDERVNREAADAASDRIALDNKLDLEIRLADRTSTVVFRSS